MTNDPCGPGNERLAWFNRIGRPVAVSALLTTCHSRRWADAMADGRPYPDVESVQRSADGARELTTHRITLAAGQSARFSRPGEETVVVLQSGTGRVSCGTQAWEVSRADVFAERATALLLPPGQTLQVEAATALEAVLVQAAPQPCSPGSEGHHSSVGISSMRVLMIL